MTSSQPPLAARLTSDQAGGSRRNVVGATLDVVAEFHEAWHGVQKVVMRVPVGFVQRPKLRLEVRDDNRVPHETHPHLLTRVELLEGPQVHGLGVQRAGFRVTGTGERLVLGPQFDRFRSVLWQREWR